MKNLAIFLTVACLGFNSCANGQINWGKTKKEGEKILNEYAGKSSTSKLSNAEVVSGLKQALEVGTGNASKKAATLHGYYSNPKIKIPFPAEAEKVKNTALNLGLNDQVNKFEYTLNRAAEEAAKEAAPIFIEAIKGMTISDGFTILNGGENAATNYLSDKTTASLEVKFQPIVQKAIDKVELTKYWNPIITKYNMVPGVQKMNPDLEKYVTQKAIAGLFTLIAEEEKNIRSNPSARITDLLKKVFGQKK